MRVTLLDALDNARIGAELHRELETTGHATVRHRLADERFAPCQGCFACWVEHPGTCGIRDAANRVMADVVGADRVVWLTRPRFACWDPTAKAALDRAIGLLSPFFGRIRGETHHLRRYASYASWHVVAVDDAGASPGEMVDFERLLARNALNFHTRAARPLPLPNDASRAHVAGAARRIVEADAADAIAPYIPGPFRLRSLAAEGVGTGPSRRAVLWVGSAKPSGSSTSEALGGALLRRLEARGWATDRLHLARAVRLGRDARAGVTESVARADLLVLASPIYIDSLPATVLSALHSLVDDRRRGANSALAILPIVQCGFPETSHTTLALEILERAAEAGDMRWAGHLYCGEGGAIDGRDPDESGRLERKARALDRAADELDRGEPVGVDTTEAFAAPIMPVGLYRTAAQIGWVVAAARGGALHRLRARPFVDSGEDAPTPR